MTSRTSFQSAIKLNTSPIFRLLRFEETCLLNKIPQNNNFSLIWITEGSGKVKAELAEYSFNADSLFTFPPFQPFLFTTNMPLKGFIIQFQQDLFNIYQTGKEAGVNELLYDHKKQPPFVTMDQNTKATFNLLIQKTAAETDIFLLAQKELMVAYLKILLISASRLKMKQHQKSDIPADCVRENHILHRLKEAIEHNFRVKHAPSDYASMLYVTTKTLSKVSKSYYNKSLSHIINERIITEAKRELYLTKKAIKEIAYDLGYEDEYYFSRFFKINTRFSPREYREQLE